MTNLINHFNYPLLDIAPSPFVLVFAAIPIIILIIVVILAVIAVKLINNAKKKSLMSDIRNDDSKNQ